jgi:CxxC-x17-CxxC domain-containing protein
MKIEDVTLVCGDCGSEFTFSAEEQEFFMEKGFQTPKRCKPCRLARKQRSSFGTGFRERRLYSAICAECGQDAQVPFKPREDKPVYCRECYQKRRRY